MASSVGSRGQGAIRRVIAKLNNSLDAGNYYEAHQMYRMLYYRYYSQGKYSECMDLLWTGAQKMGQAKQESCAVDLAKLFIDALVAKGYSEELCKIWVSKLAKFIKSISPSTVERESLIKSVIKWSKGLSGKDNLTMHKYLGHVFRSEGNFEQARHHYFLAEDGRLLGVFLIKFHQTKGYKNEFDLFIVQTVFQLLLAKKRHVFTRTTFSTYTTHHPQIRRKSAPFKQPLLNFLHMLLVSIESGNTERIRPLCDVYALALKRDPTFVTLCAEIIRKYEGTQRTPSVSISGTIGNNGGFMGNFVGDILSEFFQGLHSDANNQEQSSNTPAPSSELD